MRRAMVAITAVLALLLSGGPATAARAAPAPGAAGIGDSYFPDYGNGGYEVSHYDIRLRYQPETDRLTGTTTILARAGADLSRFNLDFALTVSSVRVNGRPAGFAREGDHELVVTPARPVPAGARMTVVVQYSGVPSQVVAAGYTAWTRTPDGALAVGEPEIAWWWFPSNDHPLDKATFDISVLVPDGVEVLSNGVMPRAPRAELPGWTRWSWRSTSPMATYLAFLVIGQYDIVTDTAPGGQPVVNAYSTLLGDLDAPARASVERTSEIVDWLSGVVGPYPFEAQGGVVVPVRTLGFALENQTRSVYAGEFFLRGSNPYVVVHENAHQWFGDSLAVREWREIWLNEGFATYSEWLFSEYTGEGTAQELFDFTYALYPADAGFWQVVIGNPGPSALFADAVYDRGAMTVHQLRLAVGDEAFFEIVRTWATEHRHGNVDTGQLVELAERISGQQLDALFQTWVYSAGRPDPAPARTLAAATPAAEPRSWARIRDAHRHG